MSDIKLCWHCWYDMVRLYEFVYLNSRFETTDCAAPIVGSRFGHQSGRNEGVRDGQSALNGKLKVEQRSWIYNYLGWCSTTNHCCNIRMFIGCVRLLTDSTCIIFYPMRGARPSSVAQDICRTWHALSVCCSARIVTSPTPAMWANPFAPRSGSRRREPRGWKIQLFRKPYSFDGTLLSN